MNIDWNQHNLRLAADPLAVARQARSLPPVAMCLLRLLDGHKTVQDTLRMSPVSEETARAVLRRLTELGLAHPVSAGDAKPETRVEGISEPLRAWLAAPRGTSAETVRTRLEAPLTPLDDLLDELTTELADPEAGAAELLREAAPGAAAAPPPLPTAPPADTLSGGRTPSSLQEAMTHHLGPETGRGGFDDHDLAFFDSYVPEEPMTDTFSDLVSRKRSR